jgi:hypothetical protein
VCVLKVDFFSFVMGIIHWSITKNNNQALDSPKINMLYPLGAGYIGHKRRTYAKIIWDKPKSYWVHVEAQVGNKLGTTKSQHP